MAYTTINKSKEHFDTLLYTATGTQSVTGTEFQPDFSWVKSRSTTSSHYLLDAVRGSTKTIKSDSTDAEGTQNLVTSFNSDGVTLGSANWSDGRTAVIWNWKANGTGSANTDGSISSTVSVNTTSGFSIVSYTGTGSASTIGHGLGSTPKIVIVKRRNNADGWQVYVDGLSSVNHYLRLDTTAAEASDSTRFGAAPTSSVFSVGTANGTNASGDTYIAYCFAEKTGYSKFGSFTGNANAEGTFVYTGFKPAFLMIKRATGGTGNWHLFDSKRLGYNVNNYGVQPNLNSAENTANDLDLLSNGFKNRQSGNDLNGSNTYIYMAFAEAPLVGTNNVPCTAR